MDWIGPHIGGQRAHARDSWLRLALVALLRCARSPRGRRRLCAHSVGWPGALPVEMLREVDFVMYDESGVPFGRRARTRVADAARRTPSSASRACRLPNLACLLPCACGTRRAEQR